MCPKRITEDIVDYVTHLARLEITSDERTRFTSQIQEIIEYVDMLQQIDTSGIEATFQVLPTSNVMREDVVKPSLPVEQILANAPEKEIADGKQFFKMPKIIETED